MGLFGPPNIEKLKSKQDVTGLIKALGYVNEAAVRRDAAKALGELGSQAALEPLAASLNDRQEEVRRAAAGAIIQVCRRPGEDAAREKMVGTLLARLKERGDATPKEVFTCLGQLGDQRLVEPLCARLSDTGSRLRLEALAVIDGICTRLGGDACAGAVSPLIAVLQEKPGEGPLRASAGALLAKIGAPAAGPLVALLLHHRDNGWELNGILNRLLADIGQPAIPALVDSLGSAPTEARQVVVGLLEKLGWQPGRDKNAALYYLEKKDWDKLAEIGEPAIQPLIANISTASFYGEDVLVRIGEPALEPLLAAFQAGSGYVLQNYARIIGRIGAGLNDPEKRQKLYIALVDVLQHGSEAQRLSAAAALGQTGGTEALEPLLGVLAQADKSMKVAALQALGNLGSRLKDEALRERTGSCLAKQVGAADADVRRAATEALKKMDWQPSAKDQPPTYWIGRRDWEACVKIGAPAVKPLLKALAERAADDPTLSSHDIVETLTSIGASAVPGLVSALKDANPQVRQCAAQALEKIGWEPDAGEAGSAFWDAKLERLLERLGDPAWLARQQAAEELVGLYRSGKLGSTQMKCILAQRSRITTAHADEKYRIPSGPSSDCTHNDQSIHTDRGIGVEFPV